MKHGNVKIPVLMAYLEPLSISKTVLRGLLPMIETLLGRGGSSEGNRRNHHFSPPQRQACLKPLCFRLSSFGMQEPIIEAVDIRWK